MFFAGCVSRLVRIGPETYMASKHDYLFGTTEGMVADAVEDANAFCARQGRVAMVIKRRSMWAEGSGRAEVIFQCADPYPPRVQYRPSPTWSCIGTTVRVAALLRSRIANLGSPCHVALCPKRTASNPLGFETVLNF